MATSKRVVFGAVIGLLLSLFSGVRAADRNSDATQSSTEIKLVYLGNAGWQISDSRTVVLVDPFLSQFSLSREPTGNDTATPDTVAIDRRIPAADYIFITHGHLDHMLDAPYIALKTGATVIGLETVANIARAYGVSDTKLITVRGGEDYEFGRFSLRVIPSLHSALREKRWFNSLDATATAPRDLKAPLKVSAFVAGGSLVYLLRMAGHQILIMGSMNYIEREMEGLRPDIALVGANRQRREIYDYAGRLMRALGLPPTVLPTHWDAYGRSAQQKSAREAVEEFVNEVKAASSHTNVIVPRHFEPIMIK